MMTTYNREIQEFAQNYYARWWQCFVAVFFVAALGVAADAAPLTFDDPTFTTSDQFGESVALDGNNVLIGAWMHNTLGNQVGHAYLFDAVTGNVRCLVE